MNRSRWCPSRRLMLRPRSGRRPPQYWSPLPATLTVTSDSASGRSRRSRPSGRAWLPAVKALENWSAEAPLFPIGSQRFYRLLGRCSSGARLGKITTHALLRSAVKRSRETGASINKVGAVLGHRLLHTAARPLALLEGEHDDGRRAAATPRGV